MNNKITDKFLSKIRNTNEEYIECVGYGDYDGAHVGGYRYSLEIKINDSQNNKTLFCIMMNPSTTFPDEEWLKEDYKRRLGVTKKRKGFDATVKNVIRMAHAKKYNKVIIFNVFPYIQPNGKKALEYMKEGLNDNQEENKQKIKELKTQISNYNKILIAWGHKIPEETAKEYLELIKQEKFQPIAYKWNEEENYPYHPSQQVDNRFTTDENGKIRQKRKGKNEVGIISQFINDSSKDFIPLKIQDGKLIYI